MYRRTILAGLAALFPAAWAKAQSLGIGSGVDDIRKGMGMGGGGGGGSSGARVTMGTAVYSTGAQQFVLASKTAVVSG